jgi:hypothetical protein
MFDEIEKKIVKLFVLPVWWNGINETGHSRVAYP